MDAVTEFENEIEAIRDNQLGQTTIQQDFYLAVVRLLGEISHSFERIADSFEKTEVKD